MIGLRNKKRLNDLLGRKVNEEWRDLRNADQLTGFCPIPLTEIQGEGIQG